MRTFNEFGNSGKTRVPLSNPVTIIAAAAIMGWAVPIGLTIVLLNLI